MIPLSCSGRWRRRTSSYNWYRTVGPATYVCTWACGRMHIFLSVGVRRGVGRFCPIGWISLSLFLCSSSVSIVSLLGLKSVYFSLHISPRTVSFPQSFFIYLATKRQAPLFDTSTTSSYTCDYLTLFYPFKRLQMCKSQYKRFLSFLFPLRIFL